MPLVRLGMVALRDTGCHAFGVRFWPSCEVAPRLTEVRSPRQIGPDFGNLSSSQVAQIDH